MDWSLAEWVCAKLGGRLPNLIYPQLLEPQLLYHRNLFSYLVICYLCRKTGFKAKEHVYIKGLVSFIGFSSYYDI